MILNFLYDLWLKHRWQGVGLVILFVCTGLFEGGVILLLLPLLAHLGLSEQASSHPFMRYFDELLQIVGLPPTLLVVFGIVIVVIFGQFMLLLLQSWTAASLAHSYTQIWRQLLFDAMMESRWRFFLERKGGQLANTIIGETARLTYAMNHLAQIAALCVTVATFLTIAFLVSWQISLVLICVGGSLVLGTKPLQRRAIRLGLRFSEYTHDLQGAVLEFVAGAKLLKASGTEPEARRRFADIIDRIRGIGAKMAFDPQLIRGLYEFAGGCALAFTLVVATQYFEVGLATLAVVLALFFRLYPRLSSLEQNRQAVRTYISALASVQSMLREAQAEAEQRDGDAEATLPGGAATAVDLRALTVSLGGRQVLDDVTLAVPAGSTVAIVGASGAGKSTLVDAVLRLVEPDSGNILVDYVPLEQLPLRAWRRSVGYVAQDTFLFHASLRENIAWGHPSATDAEIAEAARKANAHSFILETERGYDTVVGDRGVRLSGGQRQRIGLARALLGRKRLLLLDEATSALDSESEALVMESIQALHGELTIVMIAHRLSTVRSADAIYVLDAGRVIQQGSWQELTSQDGSFRTLWRMQSEHPA